ncbi:MAG: tail fiber domain-containing protein [bacterium]
MIVCNDIIVCDINCIDVYTVCAYNFNGATACLSSGICSSNIRSNRTIGYGICAPDSCGCAVDWVATSDVRVKENIQPISNALSTVNSMCGVYYNLCNCDEPRSIGLIAQDVQPILPEVVSTSEPNKKDEKYGITDVKYGIKYNKITAILIEAIKEQQIEINNLHEEVNTLKQKL